MIPSLEQLCANIESQALSKNFENDLNKLGEKFFTLLSLTSKEPEFYKFINSFNERDKFFFLKMLSSDKLSDQQVLHLFISKEQLNTEITELRNKQHKPQEGLRVQTSKSPQIESSNKTTMTPKMTVMDIFQTSHGVSGDQKRTESAFKGSTAGYGRTFAEHQGQSKPGVAGPKNAPVQDTGALGLLYLFAQIEPAYYLVLTKCVTYKDIRQF